MPSASSPVTASALGPIAATYTGSGVPPATATGHSGARGELVAVEVDGAGVEDGPQHGEVFTQPWTVFGHEVPKAVRSGRGRRVRARG